MKIKLRITAGAPVWRNKAGHQMYVYDVDLEEGKKDVCKVYSEICLLEDVPCDAEFVLCSKKNVLTLVLQDYIDHDETRMN